MVSVESHLALILGCINSTRCLKGEESSFEISLLVHNDMLESCSQLLQICQPHIHNVNFFVP